MSRFRSALDETCDEQASALKRDLNSDEVEELEDRALASWIKSERFDELIEHAHEEFELRDGEAFCMSLGSALARRGDRTRFVRLFQGLAKSREAAFWRTWPQAQSGHVGAMKESAMHAACALDAMAALYTCYRLAKDSQGQAATKDEMLRLQGRTAPLRVKRSGASEA